MEPRSHPTSNCHYGSGVLPIARDTQRIGLVWRSRWVRVGNCWGTIGGINESGGPLGENARKELREETGYSGEIDLRLLSVFSGYRFRYYNFAGIVPFEFVREVTAEHSWENDSLHWFQLSEILHLLRSRPESFHFGVTELFQYGSALIVRILAEGLADQASSRVR